MPVIKNYESGSVDIFDTSETESQESLKSSEASITMDTETNESGTITPEDIFNMESSTPKCRIYNYDPLLISSHW